MAYPKVFAKCNNVPIERSLFDVQHFRTVVRLESAFIYNDEYPCCRTPQSTEPRAPRIAFRLEKITEKCVEIGFSVRGF
jgi:hypothetical protein